MTEKVVWQEMFKDEFEAARDRRPVCYLSFGLSEPHGLQNAMGLDGLKAYALVRPRRRNPWRSGGAACLVARPRNAAWA